MSGLLLKRGVTQGLSPAELASFYVRRDVNQERPCPLECIVQECVERAKTYCAMPEDGARAGGVGAEWGRGARVMSRPFVQHDFPQAGEGGDGAELLHAVHELAGLLGGAVPLPSGGCCVLV